MHIKGLCRFAVALLLMLLVSGCGDGNSNTNGTLILAVSAPVSSRTAIMTATATISPVSVGSKVNLVATQFGYNGTAYVTLETISQEGFTDNKGVVTFTHNFAQSDTMDTNLQVTASCAGLSDVKTITIPKFVP